MSYYEVTPATRGYTPLYYSGATHCPGCHGTHWNVGRTVAECASCGTALPIPAGEELRARAARVDLEGRQ